MFVVFSSEERYDSDGSVSALNMDVSFEPSETGDRVYPRILTSKWLIDVVAPIQGSCTSSFDQKNINM